MYLQQTDTYYLSKFLIKMATTNRDRIEEQPQLQYNTSCSEQQLDEDGEVIIIDGKCYKGGLMSANLGGGGRKYIRIYFIYGYTE